MSQRSPRRGIRAGSDGQASLEYLAVMALITVVLGVVGTVTAGPALVNGVGAAFQRALCRVTGEGCGALDRPVCTVRTAGTDIRASVKLALVRIGRSTVLLRSERSDGTVDLTLLDKVDGGLTAGVGASGRVEIGGRPIGISALAEAAAVAELGGGRVWRVPDVATADRLQRKLVEVIVGRSGSSLPLVGTALAALQSVLDVGSGVDLPRPTSRILSGRIGVKGTFDGPFGSELQAAAGVALGGSTGVGGAGTIYLALDGRAGVELLAGAAGLRSDGDVKLALAFDGRGRPVSLSLTGTGRVHARRTEAAKRADDRLDLARGAASGTGGQVTATLDLTDSGHAAAAARLLHALAPGGAADLPAAARALGGAFAADARLDVAEYDHRERRYGGGVEAGLGAEAGLGLEVIRSGGQLVGAWTRPPGGAWERRADCLAHAGGRTWGRRS